MRRLRTSSLRLLLPPFVLFAACGVLYAQSSTIPAGAPATDAAAAASKLTAFEKHKPEQWEKSIAGFEALTQKYPPPEEPVVFIGSSSIAKWKTLKADFPGIPVMNRGFGGSFIEDSTFYVDRILVPYHPREIVFFAGDNDIAAGRSSKGILADFTAFVNKVRSEMPDVPIILLSIKPSPSRVKLHDKQVEANRLLAAYCATAKRVTFVDIYTPMLGLDGQPIPDLFVADRLHMTPKGYELWTKILTPYVK